MTTPKWILLVEDNPNDAEMALRAMSADQASRDVIVVRDGAEALDCLFRRGSFQGQESGNPTLVLLDLKMPRVNGLEVLQQVRGDPALRQIPVVMFTSSREESDVIRSYQLGANAYIVKPMDFKQFHNVVQEIRRYWMEINEPPPVRSGRTVSNQVTMRASL